MFPFADSINPNAIDPSRFSHVAAYMNGRYAWPVSQLRRFPYHILIGVLPGQPSQARLARALDMERYDANALDFPPFVQERVQAGHNDALGYTSILGNAEHEGIEEVVKALDEAAIPDDEWALWVAWWWGRLFPPTATEVLREIETLTNVALPSRHLAACQWRNGLALDTSIWYGRNTFTRA